MQKTLITGPESSGKSQLASSLATCFPGADWTPEYARYYLGRLDRPYQEADLWHIAQGQLSWERQRIVRQPSWLFCDTGPEVIYIWSMVKYGFASPALRALVREVHYDLTLLCYPDLPWEPDPLREAPDLDVRIALFDEYCRLLQQLGREFEVIEGQGEARTQLAMAYLSGVAILDDVAGQ